MTPPRIIIYGTGQYGQCITRFATEKGWPIVAAFNRAGPKIGQDIGRLSGLDRDLGVVVQDCDEASFEGLEADIGVVAMTNMLAANMPAYERLMGAGLNVICHGTEAYYPYGNDVSLASNIDKIAKAKGVTFSGGGIWDMSRIWAGILAAGPCTNLNSLFHTSITDCSAFGKPAMMFTGVGKTLDEFAALSQAHAVFHTYKTIPEQVLTALGFSLSNTTVRVDPVTFDEDIECPLLGRSVLAGECAGARIVADVATKEGISGHAEIELRLFRDGEVEHMFWSVDGMPGFKVRTERNDSNHATAACLFNRIPDVIAAPSGIVTLSEMGPMRPSIFV